MFSRPTLAPLSLQWEYKEMGNTGLEGDEGCLHLGSTPDISVKRGWTATKSGYLYKHRRCRKLLRRLTAVCIWDWTFDVSNMRRWKFFKSTDIAYSNNAKCSHSWKREETVSSLVIKLIRSGSPYFGWEKRQVTRGRKTECSNVQSP